MMSNLEGLTEADDTFVEDTGVDASTSEGLVDAATPDASTGNADSFTVKVDGEEQTVSLDELLSGYQRQADYTRKTQEVAALRALGEALEVDPQGTLAELAKAYGLQLPASSSADDLDLDPHERELKELRSRVERQEATARQNAVERELATVRAKYADDTLDEAALLQYAIARRIPSIEDAYKAFVFEQRTAAKTEAKKEAKRSAPRVEGGAKRSESAVATGAGKKMSVAEAFRLAQQSS